MWLMETSWFSHRPLWTFIMSGVFDRFPALRLVLAEQGSGWIRDALDTMDGFYVPDRATATSASCASSSPSCSNARRASTGTSNCAVAASFLHRDDCGRRQRIGVDHIMWGSDYPHLEGTFPFSQEAIADDVRRRAHDEVAAMLGGNAAAVYGFDLDALAPLAARVRAAGRRRRRRARPGARRRAQHGVLQTVVSNV